MRLTTHRLLTNKPNETLAFYQHLFGMTLGATEHDSDGTHYSLAFDASTQASLVFTHQPSQHFTVAPQPNPSEGYWKFSIAVDDVAATRALLLKQGVRTVGACFEVPNLARLCHLQDPNGYCIELIEKTLGAPSTQPTTPTLNLSTLRVKKAKLSIEFYEGLGMRLIDTFRSDKRQMSLYFLISERDMPVLDAHPAPTLAEKMWQFPYTILELQQLDGTAARADFRYRVGEDTGFLGLGFHGAAKTQTLFDPDGFRIRMSTLGTHA